MFLHGRKAKAEKITGSFSPFPTLQGSLPPKTYGTFCMHNNLSVSFSPESQAAHHAKPFFSARQQLQTVCFLIAPCSSNFDLHRFILSYDRQRTYILLDIRQVVSCKKRTKWGFSLPQWSRQVGMVWNGTSG